MKLRRLPRPQFNEPAEARSIQGEQLWWPPIGSAGITVTERTALKLPALLSTFAVLSTDVAVLPLHVYKRLPDGGRDEATDDPRDELLSRSPDGETTPIKWRSAWMGHALQYGNGYAEIQRKGSGQPYALHLLDPETTRPERRATGLGYRIKGSRWIPCANVLHIAGFGFDGVSGYNFVRLIEQGIGVGLGAEGYGADYFANGAEPGGVIQHPKTLSEVAATNLRKSWMEKHGARNRHSPAILEEGATWNSTSIDPEKSQLLETRKFQVTDVTRPWRVPPHKNGDFSQAHLANIEASNLDYLMTALMGWLEAIEQECNLKLFTREEWKAGFYVEHNVNALLRGDITSRFAAYTQALNNGWLNRDEVRRRENLNPIGDAQGGGKYLVQQALTTLDKIGEDKPEPAPAPNPFPAGDPAPTPDTPPAEETQP